MTVTGQNTKHPDLVLYVNGIALGVLELKRSTVSVAEGIRQDLDSQRPEFIQPFFATVQLVMAGNRDRGAALRRVNFWQAQPPKARFDAAWDLIVHHAKVKGLDVRQLRLQRSVEAFQRRAG